MSSKNPSSNVEVQPRLYVTTSGELADLIERVLEIITISPELGNFKAIGGRLVLPGGLMKKDRIFKRTSIEIFKVKFEVWRELF